MMDSSTILAGLCFVAALILVAVAMRPRGDSEKRKAYYPKPIYRHSKKSSSSQLAATETSSAFSHVRDLSDAGTQLEAIMSATFQKRKLMNMSEYTVFLVVESEIAAAQKGHRAFAQTSMGQILESPSSDAFRSINAKRVDMLVVDRGGWPVFAVEYQGPGHYQGTAAVRDAIKKEALRRAGVGYLEVTPNDGEELLRTRIREHLGIAKPRDPVAHPRKQKSRTSGVATSAAH